MKRIDMMKLVAVLATIAVVLGKSFASGSFNWSVFLAELTTALPALTAGAAAIPRDEDVTPKQLAHAVDGAIDARVETVVAEKVEAAVQRSLRPSASAPVRFDE